jgi:FkbM family methyltransferase
MNILQKILQSKALERMRRYVGKKTGLYLKLKRFSASASAELRTAMLIKNLDINLVIDVGANTGQFAESLYDFGYTHRVISFEPVAAPYEELLKRSRLYPNWTVVERCAIGDVDGEIEINVTDDTVFSSILKIKDSYVSHNPKSQIVAQEKIPIHKLDTLAHQYFSPEDNLRILIKIDTQGYEKQVLDGAMELLSRVQGIKIEVPMYAIYENTAFTFYKIIEFMQDHRFQPYSFNVEGVDRLTGRVNTIDGLFFRE